MNEQIAIAALLSELRDRLSGLGIQPEEVDRESSLLDQGILDSLSFIEFLIAIEGRFGIDLDLSEQDPEEFNSLSKLAKLVANGN